jgi:nitrate reductase (cytochrome), electron transfer subunit
MTKTLLLITLAVLVTGAPQLMAQNKTEASLNGLRGATPLEREPAAPLLPKLVNDDLRRSRGFAMQPPVIPHQIENYQVDRSFNKCMTCHSRARTGESQAPMVSVTHFVDRNNIFRSEISPRRYFCTQCHVSQLDVKPVIANTFLDAESARTNSSSKGARK